MDQGLLVDSDIIIDLLRGQKDAVDFFVSHEQTINFSAVSVAELYSGIRNSVEERAVERLFAAFQVLPVTADIARVAGTYCRTFRNSHGVEIPDALIAATSAAHSLSLCTLNCKHYPMIAGIRPCYVK
ncbi:MAG: type II toxin-antitoxin system VapC family toxin [Chitinispirillaceae bacterium]|nr:type II toxin-antitoxin system VapC family toxin [Chitinispirillaceae bacterium]